MERQQIIKILHDYKKKYAKQYNIVKIGLFGSVARNASHEGSDVDVVLTINEPDLFTIIGIKQDLESRFEQPVDIVTYREDMNQFLKNRIDKEAVYV
jgi:predicted nucleotidyltransferase